MDNFLCLDLGNTTGWAMRYNKHILHGRIELAKKSGCRFESWGMRFKRARQYLDALLLRFPVGIIYIEEVRAHKGTDAAHSYGAYLGELALYCEDRGLDYKGIHVALIKKHLTGKGNSPKEKMIEMVGKKMGIVVKDDNEADALALLSYVMHSKKSS